MGKRLLKAMVPIRPQLTKSPIAPKKAGADEEPDSPKKKKSADDEEPKADGKEAAEGDGSNKAGADEEPDSPKKKAGADEEPDSPKKKKSADDEEPKGDASEKKTAGDKVLDEASVARVAESIEKADAETPKKSSSLGGFLRKKKEVPDKKAAKPSDKKELDPISKKEDLAKVKSAEKKAESIIKKVFTKDKKTESSIKATDEKEPDAMKAQSSQKKTSPKDETLNVDKRKDVDNKAAPKAYEVKVVDENKKTTVSASDKKKAAEKKSTEKKKPSTNHHRSKPAEIARRDNQKTDSILRRGKKGEAKQKGGGLRQTF